MSKVRIHAQLRRRVRPIRAKKLHRRFTRVRGYLRRR